MNIRNHGIDTVKLTFANSKADQSRAFHPTDLEKLHMRLISLSKVKNSKWTSLSNRLNIVDSGFTDTFSFQSNKRFSSIYISLPKLIYGNNVDGLELNKTNIEKCIEKLSDKIDFDASKGRIQRLDYCFNFNTDASWLQIIKNISCKNKYYDKVVINDSTLYVQNNSQQLCFYRQDAGRYRQDIHQNELRKIERIKKELSKRGKPADCLFRVEERLDRDALKKIKVDTSTSSDKYSALRFRDLTEEYYLYNIFQKYKKLIRVPIYSDSNSKSYIINSSNITNTDEYNLHLLVSYIFANGMASVTNEFQSIKFKLPYHEKKVWDRIERAFSLLNAPTQLNSSANIKELILREIDIMFPQKPASLF